MSADGMLRGLGSAAQMAAAGAVVMAVDTLALRVAAVLPGAIVVAGDDAVRVTGPGLVVRAFGSRRQAADPRVLALVRGNGA